MQALSVRATALGSAAAVLLVVAAAGTASAGRSTGTVTGGTDLTSIDARAAAYEVSYRPRTPPPGHAVTASHGWTPPACWLAPVATPAELKAERESTWALESTGYEWDAGQEDYYVRGHPHKDFEIPNAGKGMWWNGMPNPNRLADPASLSCFKERDDWVLNGETPPAGPVVTPRILAESAYDRIRIPDKVVSLAPDADHRQTVNVPTWAWLDSADIAPVSVTARLRSLNMWATTTASPVGLRLDAGTPDAVLHPASGDCPLNADGSVGAKYVTGDALKIPPCGLTYLRSSGRGTYALTATITWKISWKGSGGTGGDLDEGVFDTRQDITVQEYQAVNR